MQQEDIYLNNNKTCTCNYVYKQKQVYRLYLKDFNIWYYNRKTTEQQKQWTTTKSTIHIQDLIICIQTRQGESHSLKRLTYYVPYQTVAM